MRKKLWGARFKKKIDQDFFQFQKSIQYDYKLAEYDLLHSLIHIAALAKCKIIKKEEHLKLAKALNKIMLQVKKEKFKSDLSAEDIHTEVQNMVEAQVGTIAQKLHTLRSRNDQVVFDEKCFCVVSGTAILKLIGSVLAALKILSNKYKDSYFLGYTHTQRAQVLKFKDYLGAFYCIFLRDTQRISNFLEGLDIYIGSGALAGSALKKEAYAAAIKEVVKKDKILAKKIKAAENPLDNVSNRDFIVEFLGILSILQMHLSRLAEDLIIYSTKEFDFLNLPEEFCTGSSLMPHKKNPDFLELVRGYTGRVYGDLLSILTALKGLPLTYNRDMQLDKEPLFSSVEIVKVELFLLAKFIRNIKLNKEKISAALEDESLYATELAEFLVFKGVPFSKAHKIVGKLIRYGEDKKKKIKDLADKTLKSFNRHFSQEEIAKVMNAKHAISSKNSV